VPGQAGIANWRADKARLRTALRAPVDWRWRPARASLRWIGLDPVGPATSCRGGRRSPGRQRPAQTSERQAGNEQCAQCQHQGLFARLPDQRTRGSRSREAIRPEAAAISSIRAPSHRHLGQGRTAAPEAELPCLRLQSQTNEHGEKIDRPSGKSRQTCRANRHPCRRNHFHVLFNIL